MKDLLEKLINKKDLTEKEASTLLEYFMSGEAPESFIAACLVALRMKGESKEEVVGFINTMKKNMVKVSLASGKQHLASSLEKNSGKIRMTDTIIDTCGTGGDGKQTFNISTAVAFVVAGAGVPVAKHGNRSASSKCGSADVLEALRVNINLNAEQASEILEKAGMVFLFAPLFHPAMKHVANVRKILGIKTVFNFIGPFSNPASVKRQIIGVPDKKTAEKLAHVAAKLGYEHVLLVSSDDGMDEISLSEKTIGFEVKGKTIRRIMIDPQKFGFKKDSGQGQLRFNRSQNDISGGDAQENSEIILHILQGKKGPARDIVLINSSYALHISGKVKNIEDGLKRAEKSIDSGAAKRVLERLIAETQKYT